MNIEYENENINENKNKNIIKIENIEENKEIKNEETEEKDIFSKKLYHEFFNENSEKDLIEISPNKIALILEQISKTKIDLNILEEKMKLFNENLSELNINKLNYDKIKILVDESQKELYNLYLIMSNELNSLKILVNIKNYNKEIYEIHKTTLEKHKENYLKTIEKLKNDINDLKKLEIDIIKNKKQIKEYLNEINNLCKNVLINMNIHLLNEEKEFNLQNKEEEENAIDLINVELILNNFIFKKNDIIEEIQRIDETNKKDKDKDN